MTHTDYPTDRDTTQSKEVRSICLLKVVEEKKKRQDGGFEIPVDIPEEVLMDIRVAELFNGNYEKVSHGRFSDKTTKVTVTYDGVSWTLSTNTLTTSFLGLPPSMKLCKFRLYQNTTVEAKNPFFKIKTLLEVMQEAVEDGGQVPKEEDLVMRLKVQVNTGNWRVGRLVFTGDTFKFVIRINREWRGARSLSHLYGMLKNLFLTEIFFWSSSPRGPVWNVQNLLMALYGMLNSFGAHSVKNFTESGKIVAILYGLAAHCR